MTRGGVLTLVVCALALVGVAQAQVGRIEPVTSGPVTFTITDADLAAAQGCPGCVVVPADPGPGVVFDVRRQNPNNLYVIDVSHGGWTPTGGPTIEIRATVTSTNGRTTYLETGWLAIGTSPTLVFDQSQSNANRVRVTVAYRLRLGGGEEAGTFTTPVTYRVRGTTQTASHATRADFPTFLALRWVGTPASGSATLRFEYATAPAAFVQAVTSGAPLPPTSADFERLEVSTNHPSGFSVVVVAVPLDAPLGAPSLVPRLRLDGVPVEERVFTSMGPTNGYTTLATPADFALAVDGTESPGAYRIELQYLATRNP
jgi:hypothetical protein